MSQTSKLEFCKPSAKEMRTMIILMVPLFVVCFGAIAWQCKSCGCINQFSFPSTYALLKRHSLPALDLKYQRMKTTY